MQHRHAAEAFGCVDDRVGVDAVVAVEIADGAGLAELLDPQRFQPVAADAAEPAQRRRMAIDHADDAAIARQRRQQFFDMAEMRLVAPDAAGFSRGGPAGLQPVGS